MLWLWKPAEMGELMDVTYDRLMNQARGLIQDGLQEEVHRVFRRLFYADRRNMAIRILKLLEQHIPEWRREDYTGVPYMEIYEALADLFLGHVEHRDASGDVVVQQAAK